MNTRRGKPLLFASSSYGYLQKELLRTGKFTEGVVERTPPGMKAPADRFPDGERYLRLQTDVLRRDAILLGGTIDDAETMELFDMGNALFDWGAMSLCIVKPFDGYSTMERSTQAGEHVKAKARARLFSAIPRTPMGNTILHLDLHSEGLPYYYEGPLRTAHIYGKDIVARIAKELAGGDFVIASSELEAEPGGITGFTLASTDAGRAKWVESLAKDLGVAPAFAYKLRLGGDKVATLGVIGDVAGNYVIIYDDMIRTGGSAIKAAQAYLAAGAVKVALIATHGVLPPGALEKLRGCGCFERVVVTNSHPSAVAQAKSAPDFLVVESVAGLLTEHLVTLYR